MARYPQGQAVRLGGGGLPITVKDSTGALTDASATTITLRKPDGTNAAPYTAPTRESLGLYHQDLLQADLALNGHYAWSWDATVTGFHAITYGTFDVFDPLEVSVMSLADAKDTLDIPQANTRSDDEIQRMVAAIEALLERRTGGPIINTPITERVDIDATPWEIKVLKRPLVSVTSITDVLSGLALDVSALDLDLNAAMVRRKDGQPFVTTTGVVTVAYVAGWGTAVPAAIASAAQMILAHVWSQSQRGASLAVPFGGATETAQLGVGYAIPNEAAELLAPYERASSG